MDVFLEGLGPDPLLALARWLGEAERAAPPRADAMALATADAHGRPSVRMVLLKGLDERGLVFYTNRESRKADELAANPRAALALYWEPLHRQARVEGPVVRLGDGESVAYFRTRPRESRLAAWASPQSRAVESRDALEALWAEADARFPGEDVPLPPFWGGYRVVPDTVELWQGRDHRFHDRARYDLRPDGRWDRVRLAP